MESFERKKVIVAFTTGAPLDAYQYGGWENFDISAFLPQFIQLTNLCSMEWAGYVVSCGYSFVANDAMIKELADKHSSDLANKIRNAM